MTRRFGCVRAPLGEASLYANAIQGVTSSQFFGDFHGYVAGPAFHGVEATIRTGLLNSLWISRVRVLVWFTVTR